ncbi:MAG: type II toxin-antitoxin system VapC family toxin [Proteobacteria bacterium]|nr:type II toxin-antitoxin system VapC family toxin [Pseudomonadota bacterium]
MYLLDTNVLSELRKAPTQMNARVKAWTNAQDVETLYISVVSVLEIRRGIHKLEQRGDSIQARIFLTWLEHRVLPAYTGRILSVDSAVALRAAVLPWANPDNYRDALVAGAALLHGATVVTRNTRDFEGRGVKLINPWEQG